MTNKKTGSMLALVALALLFLSAYVEAAERQVVMEIEGMTCHL